MKRLLLIVLIISCCSSLLMAQETSELAMIQAAWGKDKKALVKDYMDLKGPDANAFWSLYDRYEEKRRQLSRDRVDLLTQYAKSYETLTNEQASSLGTLAISNDIKTDKLNKKYFKKFRKSVGGTNAAKFFQLENYLQTLIKSSVQDDLPFIGELDKRRQVSSD